jgi:nicotinamidase/pyrazinamidase
MNHFESKEWQTARVVHVSVDPQNDFCPGGTLGVKDGDTIMPGLNQLARLARTANGIVVVTRDWHPTETNHFENRGGPWPVHCVSGTKGAEFHEDLEIIEGDIIISKGTHVDEDAYSGFQGADDTGRTLEQIITPVHDERVIVTIGGLATDYCDRATVLDGLSVADKHVDSIKIIAVTDAMKGVNINPGDDEKALREMQEAGAVLLTVNEVANHLGRLGLVSAQ